MGYNVDFDSSAPVFENHTNFNIDNVVPEKRNNTYGSDAVHRKSMNELLSTSFSEDQQKVLAYALEHSGGGGGGSSTLICELIQEGDSNRLDKTFGEIKEAVYSGSQVFVRGVSTRGDVVIIPFAHFSAYPSGGGAIQFIGNELVLSASSDSDYPSYGGEED